MTCVPHNVQEEKLPCLPLLVAGQNCKALVSTSQRTMGGENPPPLLLLQPIIPVAVRPAAHPQAYCARRASR